MIQYELLKENSSRFIKSIYKKFLIFDSDWHFFYEGDYMLLRLKERNPKIENYLKRRKVKFNVRLWEDANRTVRSRQSAFRVLFHEFSVLCMVCKGKEFDSVAERIFHCFLNMGGSFLTARQVPESLYLTYHAIQRARTEGVQLAKKKGEKL